MKHDGGKMRDLFIETINPEVYEPVPKWARYFINAGEKAAEMEYTNSQKMVIGFSVPTRSYAALFFLLGYETWNAIPQFHNQEIDNVHFRRLSACENDEALLILHKGRWKRCWFKGVTEERGEKLISVLIRGSDKQKSEDVGWSISEKNIIRLRKAVDPEREIAVNQTGFSLSGFDSLIKFYEQKEHTILRYLSSDSPSYLVFGGKAKIEKEINSANIFYISNNEYVQISLQHIIRFHNFMTEFDLSRGRIISSTREFCESPSSPTDPRIVIYDGSLAYLNHQEDLQSKMEIIFLDGAEPQFSGARSELMARYINREDEVTLFADKPDAIEVIAFKE